MTEVPTASRFPRHHLLVAIAGLTTGAVSGYALRISSVPPAVFVPLASAAGCALLFSAWWVVSAILASSSGVSRVQARSVSAWPFAAFALLPLQFIPFSVLQTAGEENVLRPLDPAWQVITVLLLSAGLVLALLSNRFLILQRGPIAAIRRHPVAVLIMMMLVWLVAASAMDILKTYYMNKIGGSNTAIFTDALRHTFSENGPLFSTLALSDGSSLLGIHSSFIWFLVYPLFLIWPDYHWLLIITNAALAATAIPIYLLGRRFFDPGLSLLVVAVFLLNRLIVAQPGIGDLSEERFIPVLFIAAFYFWHSRRFLPYLAFAFLCLTVREDMGLVLVLWGVLSLLQRRSFKWVVAPLLLGAGWLLVMAKVIMPHFNPTGQPVARAVYKYKNLGDSTGEIFVNLIKPWVLLRIPFSSIRHVAVLYAMFQSFGYGAPLLAAPVLLVLVHFMENLFLDRPGLNLFNMIPLAAILMPAMILGLSTADRYAKIIWRKKVSTTLVLMSLFSTAALSYTWFNPSLFQPRYNYDTAISMLEQMPEGASAMLPDFMAARARPSQDVRGYHQVVYEVDQRGELDLQEDFVVIDLVVPERFSDTTTYDGWTKLRATVESSADYQLVMDQDDLRMYRKLT